jgi:hypothetical protein
MPLVSRDNAGSCHEEVVGPGGHGMQSTLPIPQSSSDQIWYSCLIVSHPVLHVRCALSSYGVKPSPRVPHTTQLLPISENPLPGRAPDALDEAILLCEPVQAVVGLAHCAHETAERVGLVIAGVAAVLVDLSNADLDRGVVLGLDDAAGSAALAGDVAVKLKISIRAVGVTSREISRAGKPYRSTSSPRSFSILMNVWVRRRVVIGGAAL